MYNEKPKTTKNKMGGRPVKAIPPKGDTDATLRGNVTTIER